MKHRVEKGTPGKTGNRDTWVCTVIEIATNRKMDDAMYPHIKNLHNFIHRLDDGWDALKSAMSDYVIDEHEALR